MKTENRGTGTIDADITNRRWCYVFKRSMELGLFIAFFRSDACMITEVEARRVCGIVFDVGERALCCAMFGAQFAIDMVHVGTSSK